MRRHLPSREEAIPIAMHRVYAHEGLCSRIELYRNTPHSSFSLPPTTHHWVICQHAAGPEQLLLQADGREYDAGGMNQRQVIYIPPGTKTEWNFSPAEGSTHLLIPDRLLLEALPDSRTFSAIQERGPLAGVKLPRVSQVFDDYSKALSGNISSLSESILNGTKALAEDLTATHRSRPISRLPSEKISPETLQSIWDYMWENIDRNITLTELARVAHMSPFHFSRVFKKAANVTPHQAVIRMRVQKARTLIPRSDSLTEIAYRCGFSDQAHFTRTFKSRTGYNPKQFREMSA